MFVASLRSCRLVDSFLASSLFVVASCVWLLFRSTRISCLFLVFFLLLLVLLVGGSLLIERFCLLFFNRWGPCVDGLVQSSLPAPLPPSFVLWSSRVSVRCTLVLLFPVCLPFDSFPRGYRSALFPCSFCSFRLYAGLHFSPRPCYLLFHVSQVPFATVAGLEQTCSCASDGAPLPCCCRSFLCLVPSLPCSWLMGFLVGRPCRCCSASPEVDFLQAPSGM